MKFDFYTGAIDYTGLYSFIGYGVGSGRITDLPDQGAANGECDREGNNFGE